MIYISLYMSIILYDEPKILKPWIMYGMVSNFHSKN